MSNVPQNINQNPNRIKPKGAKGGVPLFDPDDFFNAAKEDILCGDYIYQSVKRDMTKDTERAIELADEAEKRFKEAFTRLGTTELRYAETSRKASSSVRESAKNLADGLVRIEKAANFDRLERYVLLLERAATAMTALAELEKTGRLEKIANAIK